MTGNWSLMVAVVAALACPDSGGRAQDWTGLGTQPIPNPNANLERAWGGIQKKLSTWRQLHLHETRVRQRLARERAQRPKKNNRLGR